MTQPPSPTPALSQPDARRRSLWDPVAGAGAPVRSIRAWEALDSRAHPTTACRVELASGAVGRALVPTGASVGQFEVPDLRDGGDRYGGLGVASAVAAIEALGREAQGTAVADLEPALQGPSNVTLAISIAAAKAVAADQGVGLWQVLERQPGTASLPCPMVNVFSGGRHAEGSIRIQDFLAVPTEATTFAEALHVVWAVRREAARLVEARYGTLVSKLVADEGGLAVLGDDDEEPLALLTEAIERSGFAAGIAIDVAASQIEDPAAFTDTLLAWCERYPVLSVEDPLDDDDWDRWASLSAALGSMQLVGDDLFATDPDRVHHAAARGVANTVLVKPNQVGSLSGAWHTIEVARSHGYRTVISARSGDTEDDALADLAVGWAGGQIKVGSVMRSERLAKYNRLVELEAVDALPYAGWSAPDGEASR